MIEKTKRDGPPDYRSYHFTPMEYVTTLLVAVCFFYALGLLFYSHPIPALVLCPAAFLVIPLRKKELARKRQEALNLHFKDALYYLSVSLSAGKSLEQGLLETQKVLESIYPAKTSDLTAELAWMNRRISMSETVEAVFYDLAQRSGVEDIKSFADVLTITRRAGANLMEVIKNTSTTIREKVEIRHDIATMLASKKLEQHIMGVTPLVLIFLLKTMSGEFMEPLMTTLQGRLIMTAALGLIAAGYALSKKIMSIDV